MVPWTSAEQLGGREGGSAFSKQVRGHLGRRQSSWEGPAKIGGRASWNLAQQLEGPAEAGERAPWKSAEQLGGLRGSAASGSVLHSLLNPKQQGECSIRLCPAQLTSAAHVTPAQAATTACRLST